MIEDDGELAEILTEFLAKHQIEITNYETPDLGLSALKIGKGKYDVVILDLSLPDMDGIEVCRIITKEHSVPVIISSARSDITDKVTTLGMGADDYLPKPYDPRELAVRISSVLRRYKEAQENQEEKKEEIKSDFHLDENSMEIKFKGSPLKLTKAEYGILKYFIQKRGYVVSREDIINSVDAINYESSEKSIDVIVSRIRSKIENDSKKPKYIESVRGVGYKFNG